VSPSIYRRASPTVGTGDAPISTRTPPREPIAHAPALEPAAVLIVDDDDGTRQTIARYLRLEGFTINLAATGREALDDVGRVEPAVVLLDCHLPDISGIDCLAELRRRGSQVPVVIFSADCDLDLAQIGELRASTLSKLCDLEDVRAVVASYVAVR
jgi:DNA-binding response OmpR family regulator